LNQWDKEFPGRVETIFNSLKNIRPSQLLDGQLFDFENLSQQVGIEKPILQPLVFSAVNVEKAS
ncbi:MAG: tRNA 2-thiocytidine(32) synthetase TtcA, partial [Cycloclasticus sp.]